MALEWWNYEDRLYAGLDPRDVQNALTVMEQRLNEMNIAPNMN